MRTGIESYEASAFLTRDRVVDAGGSLSGDHVASHRMFTAQLATAGNVLRALDEIWAGR